MLPWFNPFFFVKLDGINFHGCFYYRFLARKARLTLIQSPAHFTGTFLYYYQRDLASWFVAIVYFISCRMFYTMVIILWFNAQPYFRGVVSR